MSKVQICNRALSAHLGAGRINALDEATTQAEQCALHFDDALATILERHDWTFARRRRALAEVVNDREDWAHKYSVPSDMLRITWIGSNAGRTYAEDVAAGPGVDRETIGNAIYCDTATAYIRYTAKIEDVGILPQTVRNALAAELASLIAMPITQDTKLARAARDAADLAIERAIVDDEAKEPPAAYGHMPDWATARGVS